MPDPEPTEFAFNHLNQVAIGHTFAIATRNLLHKRRDAMYQFIEAPQLLWLKHTVSSGLVCTPRKHRYQMDKLTEPSELLQLRKLAESRKF